MSPYFSFSSLPVLLLGDSASTAEVVELWRDASSQESKSLNSWRDDSVKSRWDLAGSELVEEAADARSSWFKGESTVLDGVPVKRDERAIPNVAAECNGGCEVHEENLTSDLKDEMLV